MDEGRGGRKLSGDDREELDTAASRTPPLVRAVTGAGETVTADSAGWSGISGAGIWFRRRRRDRAALCRSCFRTLVQYPSK